MNPSEFNQLVQDRRSIFPKYFNENPIPDEIINQILENANWAPTHKFTEPWRFVVFKDQGLKKFADFQASRYEAINTNPDPVALKKLKTKPLATSHIIAVGMKRDENERVPEVEELIAVGCAIQNIYLSLTSYGIGGYFSTGGVTYDDDAKEFFGLGENDHLIGFFYLGNYDEVSLTGKRKPIGEKVRWVDQE